jgi:acyl carrier protein
MIGVTVTAVVPPAGGAPVDFARMADPLLEIFAEGLGLSADALDEESSPENVEQWDSLAAMNLVTLIEDTFEVSLSTRDIMKMRTIALARSVLKAKGVAGI